VGAGGGVAGGLYYWSQGQNILSGIYNGASIGISISAAYFMSAASRNWKIMADVISAGLVSGIVSYILEIGTRYANNQNMLDIQTILYNAQFKAFGSMASSMINATFREFCDSDSTFQLVVSYLDTMFSSVANDMMRRPEPPSTSDIIGNAVLAAGLLFAQNNLVNVFKNKYVPNLDRDKFDSAINYFMQKVSGEFIAKMLVGWDVKIIIETGKFLRNFL
jgi:hypothetical protein